MQAFSTWRAVAEAEVVEVEEEGEEEGWVASRQDPEAHVSVLAAATAHLMRWERPAINKPAPNAEAE